MALSTPSSLLIRHSPPFLASSLNCMAPEPVGSVRQTTEEGKLDMLQPLKQWIFSVPCLKTKNLILACPERFHIMQCQSETCHSTHKLLLFPWYLTLSLCPNSSMFQRCSLFFLPLDFVLLVFWLWLSVLVFLTCHCSPCSHLKYFYSVFSLRPLLWSYEVQPMISQCIRKCIHMESVLAADFTDKAQTIELKCK